jgi:hypothetical protein
LSFLQMCHLFSLRRTYNDAFWWIYLSSSKSFFVFDNSMTKFIAISFHDLSDMSKRFNKSKYLFRIALNLLQIWQFRICRFTDSSSAINNITYSDIYTYDECLNVLRQIDHEFLLWCSISIDQILIFITSFWRIMCSQ